MEIPLSTSGFSSLGLGGMEVVNVVDSQLAAIHPSQLSIASSNNTTTAINQQLNNPQQHNISTTAAVLNQLSQQQQQQQNGVGGVNNQLLSPTTTNNNNNSTTANNNPIMAELTVNTNTQMAGIAAAISAVSSNGSVVNGGHYDGGNSANSGGSMISSHISSLMSDPCNIFTGNYWEMSHVKLSKQSDYKKSGAM